MHEYLPFFRFHTKKIKNKPYWRDFISLSQESPNVSLSRRLFSIKIFPRRHILNKCTLIKTNTVFGLSKYSCIRIDKNSLGINSLFFYENQKFRPQGGPFVYISDFFEGVKVKFFRFMYV